MAAVGHFDCLKDQWDTLEDSIRFSSRDEQQTFNQLRWKLVHIDVEHTFFLMSIFSVKALQVSIWSSSRSERLTLTRSDFKAHHKDPGPENDVTHTHSKHEFCFAILKSTCPTWSWPGGSNFLESLLVAWQLQLQLPKGKQDNNQNRKYSFYVNL